MTPWVIDANIAVKWFLDTRSEQLVDNALALLDRHEEGEIQFVVPDLFWAEVGNIFGKPVARADVRGLRPSAASRFCRQVSCSPCRR